MFNLQKTAVHAMMEPLSINGTAATVTELDTRGIKFVRIVLQFGAIGAADFDAVAVQESSTSGSGYADITGGTVAVTATDDNKLVIFDIDMTNDRKRYLYLNLDPGAVACLVSAVAICELIETGTPTSTTDVGSYCAAGTRTAGVLAWKKL